MSLLGFAISFIPSSCSCEPELAVNIVSFKSALGSPEPDENILIYLVTNVSVILALTISVASTVGFL